MQISKAILWVQELIWTCVCRDSDIFNHRCKLQRLKIASPFLASLRAKEKSQTALQGEKKAMSI